MFNFHNNKTVTVTQHRREMVLFITSTNYFISYVQEIFHELIDEVCSQRDDDRVRRGARVIIHHVIFGHAGTYAVERTVAAVMTAGVGLIFQLAAL